ncbi:MAG: T9SS type A sorting domain-containing protein, partial [Bacteroidales bacterium]|nr:T9SS type A sorting domain-containing protein [Bacteroidales bacterium]
TTFCPCAFEIDEIEGDNNFIWAGKNVGDDWGLTSNWVVYNSSEPEYHLAANEPTNSTKVFIINSTDCNIVTPTVAEDATCGNFTINGHNIDIAENKTLTINGTATFTSGIINGNVVFGEDAIVIGTGTSSHVDGVVTKNGAANGFTFPTGSNGNLGKVVVTDGSATNVSVQYFSNPAGFSANDLPRWWASASVSGFDHVSNVEYWKISSTEAITANFVTVASSIDMHFNDETGDRNTDNIQMAFYDNNRWTNVGGSAYIGGDTLKITGAEIPASATRGISGNYTTFGSKSKSTVLPIELLSFTANCNGRSALIEWTTATEKNNDYFVLERSNDAVNFKEIARIAGAGNSIEPISYAYTDYGVRSGDNYYRLVQVDYDGTSTTSEIIVANCLGTDGEPEVLAYPNPVGDDLTLRFENFGNIQATVEVYDMLGRMVHTQKVNCSQNDYEVVLRLAGLSDGTYNVRISTKELVINRQVIKN